MLTANKVTIREIFNRAKLLEVPFFQRSYVWGDSQWERLLDDLETITRTKAPHFIGSVILKQKPTDISSSIGDIRALIDGQQRLTTLTILLKVLCLKNNNLHLFDNQFRTFDGDVVIQHNRNDIESYNRIMNLDTIEEIEPKETDNIAKAYIYFRDNIDPSSIDFNTVCNGLIFVGIDLSVDEDEQQIFDTINSLGVRLTTAELLKNYFFERNDVELYEKYWLDIFEFDDETKEYWDTEFYVGNKQRSFIDQLFFSFLQIKIQEKELDVSADDKLAFSKLDHLFISYKRFVKEYYNGNKALLLGEISEYAKKFRDAIDLGVLDEDLTATVGVKRVSAIAFALETTTLLPYILFVEKNVEDSVERNELYGYLESYIMRRICCRAQTKSYNRLFGSTLILHRVLSKESFSEFLSEQDDGANQVPSDDELMLAFDNGILTNKQTRGILYMIESRIRNRDRQSTQLLGINKYSLEHIMPKKWANHWGLLDDEVAAKARDRKILTLGNLAIITQALNASIRDANWTRKKDGKNGKDGLKVYSQGIETITRYLDLDAWNESEISKRAKWLYDHALEIWKIE